ncbi:hypothetical protein BW730_00305 [Tessaracoccus aquimaris]|uniref:Uncharacterized protein n=1 Tax=Tessaracoccus aquimaris TaxID=1332264 RepID=A0A1Q2CJF9_9ACTN|nr:hypothetical protein [Tessaracoccus aquimaris]AQP46247.1 hypothetical protein BW730_00305 [Tessaracoccus aquimaris]
MTTRRLVVTLVTLLSLFMVATVVVAIWQEDFNWGWWWTVPVGGGFLLLIIGFRVLVQRSQEAAERADLLADAGGDPGVEQ